MRLALIILIALLATVGARAAESAPITSLDRQELAPLPDAVGFAGAFAGTSNGALIVAGGANFPDGPPWQGNKKVWHDRIFVLPASRGQWQQPQQRLPRSFGYGVAITTPKGVICIGGSDANQHYRDVFRLEWIDGEIKTTDLPPLPVPLANAVGALVGNTIYIAGGSESP